MKLKKSLIYSFVATAVTLQYTASAVDVLWSGATSQDVNEPTNWVGGVLPPGIVPPLNEGDAVVNVATGNYPVVTAGESFANRDWKIGIGAGAAGRMDHSAGTVATANGSWFFLGCDGATGTYNLADATGSGGTFTGMAQGSGNVAVQNLFVGVGGLPWDQSVDPVRAGTGTLRIHTTGSFVAGGEIFVGLATAGTVHHDSGTLSGNGTFRIGENAGGNGLYNFSGGTLSLLSGQFWIGQNTATGVMNMSGGTINVNDYVAIGRDNGNGQINMSGGTFNKTGGGIFIIGASGPGSLIMSGNSLVNVTSGLTWVGEQNNATSVLTMSDTAEFRCAEIVVARDAGTNGTLTMNAGTVLKTTNLHGGNGADTVNFNGATLQASGSTGNLAYSLDTALLQSGGLTINSAAFVCVASQVFSGTGDLRKTGSGTLSLTGVSTYTGQTHVDAGTLIMSTRMTGGGAINVSNATKLGVAVAVYDQALVADSVTLAASTLSFDLNNYGNPSSIGAPLACTNALTATGVIKIQVSGTNLTVGQFPLISYGSKTGAGSYMLDSLPPGVTATLVDTGTSIDLNISSVASVEWDGTEPGEIWDINVTANWFDAINLTPGAKYTDGALVTFNGAATGFNPVLNTLVKPSAVIFDNDNDPSHIYHLTGTGAIGGSASLTKRNTGLLILDTINTYDGPTVVEGGTLEVNSIVNGGIASPLGDSSNSSSNLVLGKVGGTSARLHYTGASAVTDRGMTLLGTGLVFDHANDLTFSGDVASFGSQVLKKGAGKLSFTTPNDFTFASATAVNDIRAVGIEEGTLAFSSSGTQDVTVQNNEFVVGSDGQHEAHLLVENARLAVGNWISVARGNGTTGLHSSVTVNNGGITCNDFGMGYNAGVAGYSALASTTLNNSTIVTGQSNIGESNGSVSTLTINGTSHYTSNARMMLGIETGAIGHVVVADAGKLNVAGWFAVGNGGTGTLLVKDNALVNIPVDFNLGDVTNGNGTMNLEGSAIVNSGNFFVGKGDNSQGKLYVSGGELKVNSMYIGNNGSATGVVNQSGGTITVPGNDFQIGGNGTGTYNLSAGSVTGENWCVVARYVGSTGNLNVSGGTYNQSNPARAIIVGEEGIGTLTVSSTGTVKAAGPIRISNSGAATGVINLDGGTIEAIQLYDNGGTSTMNFNGGVLKATGPNINFMEGIDTAAFLLGGAKFHSNGFAITSPQLFQGAGGLTKLGSGTLTLTAANTYTGATKVSEGILSLANAYLADAAGVEIESGATLDLTHGNTDTVASLKIAGVVQANGEYGAMGSGAANETTAITGSGRLLVGLNPYGTWASAAGLTGANNALTADPDGDGVVNLMEYYLNGNPLNSAGGVLPSANATGPNLVLRFKRRDDANADVTSQQLQYGSDLNGWTSVTIPAASGTVSGVTFTITDNGTDPDDVEVSIPKAANTKLFGRIVITE